MPRLEDSYTRYPRPILWLVREGEGLIGRAGERPFIARVSSFYLSKLPVTNAQYEAFDASRARSPVSAGDDDPVVGVTFAEATGYCDWYARVSRKPMRLPTEIEWEYACRAGVTSPWFFGDDPARAATFVRHAGNSGNAVPALQTVRPNPFGLQSMLGGVWEWTASLHVPFPPTDDGGGGGPQPLGARVLRGGSFRVPLEELDAGVRRAANPDTQEDDVGFRIARSF